MRSFTYAHDAIRSELDELQQMTTELDPDDPEEVTELRDRFDFFTTYMGIHDDIEDAGLYPALDDLREDVSEIYEWDHEQAEEYFETFDEQLDAVESGDGSASKDDLIETIASIKALLYAHSRKEDELLLPLLAKEFPVEDQAEIAGKAGKVTPDELTEDTTKFMMSRIDREGREHMLGVYEQTMPDEKFETVLEWTREAVPEDEWEPLADSVDAVSS